MSEYLRNLPEDANLGFLFGDLHAKTSELVGELEDASSIGRGEGSGQMPVPGTDLEINRTRVSDEKAGGAHVNTHVSVALAGRLQDLVHVSDFQPVSGETPEPTRVEATRGSETVNDFSMLRLDSGMIVVRLDANGVKQRPAEPLGIMEYGPTARLAMLNDIDMLRAEIVVDGILNNMTAVRSILGGVAPGEALQPQGPGIAATK